MTAFGADQVSVAGLFEVDRQVAGLLAVAASVAAFGTFVVPLKFPSVVRAGVDAAVLQLYFSAAIFLSSWLVLTYERPFYFTYYGIIGASLWVPASLLSIFAVQFVGMAIGMGVWAGVSIVVSFLWGALVFGDHVESIPLSVIALILLVAGIGILSFSGSDQMRRISERNRRGTAVVNHYTERTQLLPESDDDQSFSNDNQASERKPILGISCAIALGFLNGSMMAPLSGLPAEQRGIGYIVSFSIGVLIVTPVCVLAYFMLLSFVQKKVVWPQFHIRSAMLPGLLAGTLWQVGNYFSIYATLLLGMTVGFPLTQLAMVVSGIWGITLYKEVVGLGIAVWFGGLVVLGAGATLLALYG